MKKKIVIFQAIWFVCSPFISLFICRNMPIIRDLLFHIFFLVLILSQWLRLKHYHTLTIKQRSNERGWVFQPLLSIVTVRQDLRPCRFHFG